MKTFLRAVLIVSVAFFAFCAFAAIDAAANFVKVTVSTGYNAAATSIVLTTGDGARLPSTTPFNMVWWNYTDYPDPSDDPNREIVTVTAVSTDTLTITRAQESTSAATHNTGAKTYKMIGGPTAKLITQINSELAAKMNGQDGIATNITTSGVSTNNSPWEVRTIPLSGTSIALSFTNGPDFTHSLVAAGADTTITFGNTSGVTNRVLALHCTTDGSHKYNVPDGVYAQTLTNQPFASGFVTLTFWIINGRTNYYVSPALVDATNGIAGITQKAQGGSGQDNSSLTFPATGILVTRTATETLDNKTLTTPTVASFVNATHNHQAAAGGGTLSSPAMVFAATQRLLGRNSASGGVGEEVTFTQFLDWVGSAAQGDILYRNGSSWVRLPAGTSGQFLQTQGAGANPQYAAAMTPTSTDTVQNKTIQTTLDGGNNTLKFKAYQDFVYPHKVDGTGATIVTNSYTSALSGLTTHAGTGGTNANYAWYRIGTVPWDLDTGVDLVLKQLAIRVSATDTGSASFSICYFSPASSAGFSPSDFTAGAGYVNFTTGTLTSPAADDTFYLSDVTLTGWKTGLTAGRPFIIGIARDGTDANNDSVTILGGTISSGRTQ